MSGNEFKNNLAVASEAIVNYHIGELGIVGLSGLAGNSGDWTSAWGTDGGSSLGSQGILFDQPGDDSLIAHGGGIYYPYLKPIENLSDLVLLNNMSDMK